MSIGVRCFAVACGVSLLACGTSTPSDEAMHRVTDANVEFETAALMSYAAFAACGASDLNGFLLWRERISRSAFQRMIDAAPTEAMRAERMVIADRAARIDANLAQNTMEMYQEDARVNLQVMTSSGIPAAAACRQLILEATNLAEASEARLNMVAVAQAAAQKPGRDDPRQWQKLWRGK